LRLPLLTILSLAAGSAAAAPFVPPGTSPPDYAMTVNNQSRRKLVVLHHGEWTRITTANSPAEAAYYRANGAVSVSDGGWIRTFRRGVERSPGLDYEPRNTGEKQTHLNEGCTVWETMRLENQGLSRYRLFAASCVTDDGIELWARSGRETSIYSSTEAVEIERRPVSIEEVRPPHALLSLDWWDRDASPSSSRVDYETVMELSDGSKRAAPSTRTIRRHGQWLFEGDIDGAQRRIKITHEPGGMRLTYESDESGAPKQLSIAKSDPVPEKPPALPARKFEPVAIDRHDTVLGESCQWFNIMPGIADAGSYACLAADGITLKEENYARGLLRRSWTAVRLTRRPVSIDEIKPPAELLQPRTWGLD